VTGRTTGTLELFFIRHADAGDPAAWSGDDADRPLSEEGRGQAARLGALLQSLDVTADALIASPKLRAVETARLLSEGLAAEVQLDQRLGGALDLRTLADLIDDLPQAAARVVLVGHDPEFSDLVSWLVGAHVGLRKGALARIGLPDRTLRAGEGELQWLVPPDAVSGGHAAHG
jgi:phosphohistidine phosphatase